MGVVLRQGFKNTIFTYLGFLVGGIYTVLLIPKVFDVNPEHWGTARYLVSYAMIIAPWAQLSLPNIIIRYFPILKEKRLKDLMFFILFWTAVGISLSILIVGIGEQFWFNDKTDLLLFENTRLVFPILIGFVLFEIAAALAKSLLKSTIPVFLKEFVLRTNIMILIVLYWYGIIEFENFILFYTLNYILNFIILFCYLLSLNKLKFKINFNVITDKEFRPIYTYAAFSIFSVGAAMLVLNIDTIMINNFLSLKDVAIYGPSIYIASSILIPSRALQSIITPVIAQSWANNAIDEIAILYKKSALGPLIITIFLFLLIWINIDVVMNYFGKTFGQGKYIILFLGIGHIINVATGINGTIINTSIRYRAELYFQITLVFMTVTMNIVLIPIYGLNGAALATAITLGFYNLIKSFFVLKYFKIHPFSLKTIYAFAIGIVFFIAINIFPKPQSLFFSAIIYTIAISLLYWLIVYFTKVSDDINKQINRFLKKII